MARNPQFTNFATPKFPTYIQYVHDFCHLHSTASERPTASMLLKHQFIQQIGISNDEDTTDGGNVNANTMTSTGVHYCYLLHLAMFSVKITCYLYSIV